MTVEAQLVLPSPAAPVIATTAGDEQAAVEAPGGATYGWVMFVAFTAAVVGISFIVCVLALTGSWLMLGIALVVHFGVTATLMKLVLGAFGSETHSYPDMHTAEAVSRAAIRAGAAAQAQPRRAAGGLDSISC